MMMMKGGWRRDTMRKRAWNKTGSGQLELAGAGKKWWPAQVSKQWESRWRWLRILSEEKKIMMMKMVMDDKKKRRLNNAGQRVNERMSEGDV